MTLDYCVFLVMWYLCVQVFADLLLQHRSFEQRVCGRTVSWTDLKQLLEQQTQVRAVALRHGTIAPPTDPQHQLPQITALKLQNTHIRS